MLSIAAGIALFVATANAALEACPSRSGAEYDFVVIGCVIVRLELTAHMLKRVVVLVLEEE